MLKIYISQPYSGVACKQDAYELARKAVRYFISIGCLPFSPILHTHSLDGAFPAETFYEQDLAFLEMMAAQGVVKPMLVLLKGWKTSEGCKKEKALAERLGFEITDFEELGSYPWGVAQ